jgi:hypothetical protein
VGRRDVYDLQVEEVNHYITKGGIVNRNCFDEVVDFLESQYVFISTWNRTTTSGQRCRVVATGNPPTTAEGLWVIKRWGPWLDPKHPNPAKPGELRWFISDEDGQDTEVDGIGPHLVGGREVYAKSRTFIPAALDDNPDLSADGQYARVLDSLPKELRDAYRDGRFDMGLKDDPWQLIPTAWIQEAQGRWTPTPPDGTLMCSLGVDVAQGGSDNNVIIARHGYWFGEPYSVPGAETPIGVSQAGLIVSQRRDGAAVVIDCGGGYGGTAYADLQDNEVSVFAYKGSMKSTGKSKDTHLDFGNKRTELYWRFREALDPSQLGGSQIMLPPDQELLSDLAAVKYQVRSNTIHAEPKEKLVARLGRSPDKGDATVMAWWKGPQVGSHYEQWKRGSKPNVNYGRKRRR